MNIFTHNYQRALTPAEQARADESKARIRAEREAIVPKAQAALDLFPAKTVFVTVNGGRADADPYEEYPAEYSVESPIGTPEMEDEIIACLVSDCYPDMERAQGVAAANTHYAIRWWVEGENESGEIPII